MMMKLKGLYLFCFMLFIITINLGDASRLNQLNRIFKSIKSEDGDMIDCVDIHHQLALDHPLLKGHTILTKPSYHPERVLFARNKSSNVESNGKKNQITKLWQLSGECPEGTIPVRRTGKEKSSIKKKPRNLPRNSSSVGTPAAVDQARHEYAIAYAGQGGYYGAETVISAWQPFVERNHEFSLSQIWVSAGSDSDLNTIEVGWTVDPEIFGDYNTRLFVYWTRDNYQNTGCYNLACSGFVQLSDETALGAVISTAGDQPEITLLVWKDEQQQVWWLQYNGDIVGYWPNSIFTALTGSASLVEWGGEIINSDINGVHTKTEMGSGSFAEAGFGEASYFRNLLVVNDANTLIPPASVGGAATNSSCYDIAIGENSDWGNYFYYGGPGRNPNCP